MKNIVSRIRSVCSLETCFIVIATILTIALVMTVRGISSIAQRTMDDNTELIGVVIQQSETIQRLEEQLKEQAETIQKLEQR